MARRPEATAVPTGIAPQFSHDATRSGRPPRVGEIANVSPFGDACVTLMEILRVGAIRNGRGRRDRRCDLFSVVVGAND